MCGSPTYTDVHKQPRVDAPTPNLAKENCRKNGYRDSDIKANNIQVSRGERYRKREDDGDIARRSARDLILQQRLVVNHLHMTAS